jgi:hypothetical protein
VTNGSWNLTGNANTTSANFLGTTDSNPLIIKTAGSEQVRVDTAGNLGIGTPNPSHPVHLAAGKALRIEGGTAPGDTADYFSFGGNGNFGIDAPNAPNGRFVVQNDGQVRVGAGTATGTFGIDGWYNGHPLANYLFVASAEQVAVGILNPNPTATLHLGAGANFRAEGGAPDSLMRFSIGGYMEFGIDAPNIPRGRFVVTEAGNVGIGTASPASTLHVAGDTTVTGDVLLTGADCAEQFDTVDGQQLEPGTVVVIDERGALGESQQAYDKRVAGVVSGAGNYRTALVLDKQQSDKSRITVALVGKVYCRVDAQQSPIEVGDLLTTSATPGHAMKAAEPLRAFGAVIGKALEPLTRGQGLIPILVALQ